MLKNADHPEIVYTLSTFLRQNFSYFHIALKSPLLVRQFLLEQRLYNMFKVISDTVVVLVV